MAEAGEEEEIPDDGIDEEVVVIIDNGSGVCKAGLSTSEEPTSIFPEVIGKPRKVWKQSLDKDIYFGLECDDIRNKLAISYPLENGIIENFEQMELLWEYTFFEQLKVDPGKHPVLLTEPPYNPKPNREKMVEIMFEAFGVPSLNVSIQGVLALLGQGRTTGLVLDSGEGVTHTIPIFDGFGLPHCINRLDLAGRELNTLLAKLLAQESCCLTTTTEQHHVRLMKEQHCYVAMDPAAEFAETINYQIHGGRSVALSDERWAWKPWALQASYGRASRSATLTSVRHCSPMLFSLAGLPCFRDLGKDSQRSSSNMLRRLHRQTSASCNPKTKNSQSGVGRRCSRRFGACKRNNG